MLKTKFNKKAITKLQGIIIAAVIIVAAVGLGAYYALVPLTSSPTVTVVKIGAPNCLTGPNAKIGIEVKRCYQMFEDEFNAAGGFKSLGGAKLQMVHADIQSDTALARSETERLILVEKVHAVIGAITSGLTLVSSDVAAKYNTPYYCGSASSPLVTQRNMTNIFRSAPLATDFKPPEFIHDVLHATRVAIVYENTDWGTAQSKAMKDKCEALGMTVVLYESYTAGATDFSSLVMKIKNSNPDALIPNSYVGDAILLMNTLAQQGGPVGAKICATGAGFMSADFVKGCGANAEGIFSHSSMFADVQLYIPGRADFVARYKSIYHEDVSEWGVTHYAGLCCLVDAIERAGSVDANKIIAALRAASFDSIMGHLEFKENGDWKTPLLFIAQVQNGTFRCVWPAGANSTMPILG